MYLFNNDIFLHLFISWMFLLSVLLPYAVNVIKAKAVSVCLVATAYNV